jgi:4a-hydroxytetrahydrobiopterin dehydratase
MDFMAKDNIPTLEEKEILERLKDLPGWEYKENKIKKEFKFEDYGGVINFIDSLTEVFQETDHHPDIHIYYSRVVFELYTHSSGNKVTEIDFIIASEIERVYSEFSQMIEIK